MFIDKVKQVNEVVKNYFEGIYHGNVAQLKSSFADTAYIYGDIKGVEYARSLEEYLNGVASRQSPSALGESFEMVIEGVNFIGMNALVKVHLPMLGYNYYDFLSIVEGKWKIVGKIFSHVE